MKEIKIKDLIKPLVGDEESSYRVVFSFNDDKGKPVFDKAVHVKPEIAKGRTDLEIADIAFEMVQRVSEIQKFLEKESSPIVGQTYVPRAERLKEKVDGDIR